jgi:hypothetical protein
MGPAEDYRAKAAEYERLTRATKSPRESRNYRRQAEMYRALALGEEPDISPAPRAAANRCPNCDAPIPASFESKYLSGHLVEHHWRCQRCNVSWQSRFDPLLA